MEGKLLFVVGLLLKVIMN